MPAGDGNRPSGCPGGAGVSALPRRILVPIDFDRRSRRAVRYARALACVTKAEICLLHVVPMPPDRPLTSKDRWWIDLAQRTLAGVAQRARLAPGTSTCVLTGPIPASIGRYAVDHGFDLVVISGRGHPDWHDSLLGPTASAILRHSRVPVLIIPAAPVAGTARTPLKTAQSSEPVASGKQP
jgi:nucleotide-binding universal stress UspA family protein